MQTHSSLSVNMWVGSNVLCFLFSYYEASVVICFNYMIRGRLQDLQCRQTISKRYCFRKLEITRFESFKSLCLFLKIQTFTLIMLSS